MLSSGRVRAPFLFTAAESAADVLPAATAAQHGSVLAATSTTTAAAESASQPRHFVLGLGTATC